MLKNKENRTTVICAGIVGLVLAVTVIVNAARDNGVSETADATPEITGTAEVVQPV